MTWMIKASLALLPFVGTCLAGPQACLGPSSTAITSDGGATYYPKAQSFSFKQDGQVHIVELYMQQAYDESWKVRLLTDLPEGGGERGRIDQQDLDAKTIGESFVSSSSVGWVRFNFNEPIPISAGDTYYVFVDSYDLGDGPDAYWAGSPEGAQPGPYDGGTGWIFVYDWSDNSNYQDQYEMHTDYAFHVFNDCPVTCNFFTMILQILMGWLGFEFCDL